MRLHEERRRRGRCIDPCDHKVIDAADLTALKIDVVVRVAPGFCVGIAQDAVRIDLDARLAGDVEGIAVSRVRDEQLHVMHLARHRRAAPHRLGRRRYHRASIVGLQSAAAAKAHAEVRLRAVHRAQLVRRRLAEIDRAPIGAARRADVRREFEADGESAHTVRTVEIVIKRGPARAERRAQEVAAVARGIADLRVARRHPRDCPERAALTRGEVEVKVGRIRVRRHEEVVSEQRLEAGLLVAEGVEEKCVRGGIGRDRKRHRIARGRERIFEPAARLAVLIEMDSVAPGRGDRLKAASGSAVGGVVKHRLVELTDAQVFQRQRLRVAAINGIGEQPGHRTGDSVHGGGIEAGLTRRQSRRAVIIGGRVCAPG